MAFTILVIYGEQLKDLYNLAFSRSINNFNNIY